jgi:Holliday junction resolvase RusA-like endonuclease
VNLIFEIPGPPQPKERARRNNTTGRWYTPERTRLYERHARSCATVARMSLGRPWPMDAAYRVEIVIYMPDRRTRDGDNVFKAVADAGNRVLWNDDRQIKQHEVTLELDRERPRVEVRVEVLE